MKRKLMFGITVLFMIIAVIFTACPSDDDSSSGGSSSSSSGGDGPNAGPPLDYNKGGDPNDPTYKDDDTTLSITVPQDENDPVVYYSWYMNKANNNTTGTLIPEASGPDKSEYKPDTTIEGKTYYYVVITFRSGKKITSQTREVWVIKVSDNQRVASLPKITRQPEGAVYSKGAAADDLTVEAEIPETEGGTLSYQWFQNTASNNTNGTAIADTNKPNYKPSTANVGKIYYYVEVTNTIPDNQDGGKKSRTTKSNPVLIEVKNFLNAPVPVIKTQPVDALYEVFDPAVPLTVVLEPIADPLIAELTKTTYKWFKIEKQAYGGLEITTEPSYTPPTDENKTLWYYYCEITNTMDTAPAGYILVGTTASVKSVIVSVGVGVKPVNIGGLSVQPKTYNGDKAATITGAATGLPVGAGITLHWGDAYFEQPDVGTGIKVEFSDWYLQGDPETVKGYKLNMPSLTGIINPADGADVAAKPELDDTLTLNPTSFKITVKPVALADTATEEQLAQQTVEYTVATTNNVAMASLTGWQDGPALNVQYNASGYYIYARSKKSVSNNFTA
ncbi:MAG: hypothetical protein LBC76_05895, partial [Treponema sp.]|nr:hypothetical protein [Treponema sp.]